MMHDAPRRREEEEPTAPHIRDEQLEHLIESRRSAPSLAPPTGLDDEAETLLPIIDLLHRFAGYLSAPPDLPRQVGKYQVIEELGAGGQAITCKAFDPDTQRHVVLKLYHGAADEAEQETVLREARALARVNHPFVARCLGVDRHEGIPFLVMEHVAGRSLARLYHEQRPGVAVALELTAGVAEGLAAVHACDVRHRDVKPENVLVDAAGLPRLIDFGLTVRPGEEARSPAGTLAYMPPEQARGEGVDARSDLFGLGGVLYFLLTGQPPYPAGPNDSAAERLERARACRIVPPRQRAPAVPAAVSALCMRCLAAEPAQRFESAREVVRAIRRLQRRRWLPWLAGGILAACLGPVLAGWLVRGRPPASDPVPGPGDGPPRTAGPRQRLFVEVKESKSTGQWQPIQAAQARPVRPGNLFRVRVELEHEAHVYLLLLSSQGEVVPLYPWNRRRITIKDVDSSPGPVQPVRRVISPELREEHGWRFDRHEGLETIILLARARPLPEGFAFRKLLGPLPHGNMTRVRDPGELAVLHLDPEEEQVHRLLWQDRGIDDEAEKVDQPLHELRDRVRGTFEVFEAYRFAHVAK